MKKLICLLMALLLCICVPAHADGIEGMGSDERGLTVDIQISDPESVIYVDVDWSDLSFSYTAPTKGTWNPRTHQYDGGLPGKWTKGTARILVTNHSNVAVGISAEIKEVEKLYGVSVSMINDSFTLKAVDEATGLADSDIITVTLSSDPDMARLENLTKVLVGSMTIQVSAP